MSGGISADGGDAPGGHDFAVQATRTVYDGAIVTLRVDDVETVLR